MTLSDDCLTYQGRDLLPPPNFAWKDLTAVKYINLLIAIPGLFLLLYYYVRLYPKCPRSGLYHLSRRSFSGTGSDVVLNITQRGWMRPDNSGYRPLTRL